MVLRQLQKYVFQKDEICPLKGKRAELNMTFTKNEVSKDGIMGGSQLNV